MKAKNKAKSAARTSVPQSQTECAQAIRELGDLQRELTRQTAQMNDYIAEVTERYQAGMQAIKQQIQSKTDSIQTWAEANRVKLLGEGDKLGKTANLVTGEISWRIRPPSVRVSGADTVIDTLQRAGLDRFVRVKTEVNKEAVLNEPDAVRGIAGLTISSGIEDFVITPFEQEVV